MSELKAGDKVVQQMTRNGAVEINKATGDAESISAREPTTSPDNAIIDGAVDRLFLERRAWKKRTVRKANRKIFESVQRKPETSRLNFTDAERADPAMSKAIKKSDKAADRYEKAVKANVNAIYKRDLQMKPELEHANPVKKALHKRKIKRDYAKAFRQGNIDGVKQTAQKAKKAAQKATETTKNTVKFAVKNWKLLAIIGGLLFFVILLAAGISSCMALFGGGGTGVVGTSYTAEDADIIGADDDYTTLENSLQQQINNIPSDYPGYDEYNYSLDAIGHDPFALASYLTAKYNAYTRTSVNGDLAGILSQQYRLTLTPVTEIRYRTETRTGTTTYTDPDTGETYEEEYEYEVQVPYYYYILNVSLVNYSLESVALSNLTPEQYEMYLVYMETKGNKPELFP